MATVKIVSNNAGVKLLHRNKMYAKYSYIFSHVVSKCEFHSSINKYLPFTGDLYSCVVSQKPVLHRKILHPNQGISLSVLLSLSSICQISYPDEHTVNVTTHNFLVIATEPMASILYRLYKQAAPYLPNTAEIVVIRAKQDKNRYYSIRELTYALSKVKIFSLDSKRQPYYSKITVGTHPSPYINPYINFRYDFDKERYTSFLPSKVAATEPLTIGQLYNGKNQKT